MALINRTLKIQVAFPGWRTADLEPKKDPDTKKILEPGLWYQLMQARGELTEACNRLMTALFMVKQKALAVPTSSTKKHPNGPVPLATLAYQGLNGKWQPFGKPLYNPKGRGTSSHVLLGLEEMVVDRINEDYRKVLRGERALSNFKSVPFIFTQGFSIRPDTGLVDLPLWKGWTKDNILIVVPCKMNEGQRTIWNRIRKGEYKATEMQLVHDDKKHKWFLCVSWKGQIQEKPEGFICGVDLGMVTTAYLGFVDPKTGKALREHETINLPETSVKAWNAVDKERRERSRFNREIYDLRTGHGVTRKIRVTESLSDKKSNIVDTTVKQTASVVVKAAIAHGASTIVLEDLTGITEDKMKATAGLTSKERARARNNFLQWQQGALRTAIKNCAESSGLRVIEIDPAYTSRTCHVCGKLWKIDYRKDPTITFGRISQKWFKCDCDFEGFADWNASINIALKGLRIIRDEEIDRNLDILGVKEIAG